jgi:ABC-type nickel/cobalt efflux system permease component RcnA
VKRLHLRISLILVLSAFVGLSGCGGSRTAEHSDETEHEHAHSHEGVHGGQVIELGDEKYHAELVHDDATHKVGVYLLDGTAKVAAPIDAPSITINCCSVGDQPDQYKLEPMAQPGDPPGTASYFELTSEELCDGIDTAGAVARLSITIDGKPYSGDIETHAHDHDHEHGDEHDHDHD